MSQVVLSLLLLAVELGGGFGSASATVVSTTAQSVVVELEVAVEGEVDAVVAHFALPGEDQVTTPLVERGGGVYGVTTELKPADYAVVFEVVGEPGFESDPVTLTELGADLTLEEDEDDEEEEEGQSPESNRWMWLGVALGAASLSALAFWVLGGRDEKDDGHEPPELSADEPVAGPAPSDPSSFDEPTSDT